ncbi:MAG: DUF1269 domain-containing protein [Thermoleophilaceae bacterium]
MSNLIAVAYDDLGRAEEVMQTLQQLQYERTLELDDAVVVEHGQDGKVKLHQGQNMAAIGGASGAMWGGLIGLLFLAPLLGAAVGGAAGAATGAATDTGVDDGFMRELGEQLPPGGAAVIVLIRKSTPDKVIPEVSKYGGHVVKTSLSAEADQRLEQALQSQRAAV